MNARLRRDWMRPAVEASPTPDSKDFLKHGIESILRKRGRMPTLTRGWVGLASNPMGAPSPTIFLSSLLDMFFCKKTKKKSKQCKQGRSVNVLLFSLSSQHWIIECAFAYNGILPKLSLAAAKKSNFQKNSTTASS